MTLETAEVSSIKVTGPCSLNTQTIRAVPLRRNIQTERGKVITSYQCSTNLVQDMWHVPYVTVSDGTSTTPRKQLPRATTSIHQQLCSKGNIRCFSTTTPTTTIKCSSSRIYNSEWSEHIHASPSTTTTTTTSRFPPNSTISQLIQCCPPETYDIAICARYVTVMMWYTTSDLLSYCSTCFGIGVFDSCLVVMVTHANSLHYAT
ncbi:hypothetical protein BSL78_11417 [Apostichopus japonicus]|uniref:Uncharacterized protein n=1 Tax=Stichopus japonicus TaxID=307972 RepID=A0A2G8KUL5_STIJA|nr:hypothetical protein BSL78_11417 [Apostichopus japonicus]